jgi:hypothetical protein
MIGHGYFNMNKHFSLSAVALCAVLAQSASLGAQSPSSHPPRRAGQNVFIEPDAEQCGTGIRCITGGLQRNTFIGSWCEYCTTAWVTEDSGCSNMWLNQYVRVADGVSQTFGTTTGYMLGNIIASPVLQTPTTKATQLINTSEALTNGAGSATATMTNGPTAGNPTKWIPINDNGTTRYIPAW